MEQLLRVVLQQAARPQETALLANYPNPFNPETWIPYQLAKPAEVTVSIHTADGKLVRTLALGQLPAGVYQDKDRAVYWDGKNEQGESLRADTYFYTLKAGDFAATKKMFSQPAEVTVSIHTADGKLVRTLALGQLPAGVYQDKDRAVYWDGKNEQGESVASGVYFYTLKAGEFAATKKMLIRK